MKSKRLIFFIFLIFIIVLSASAISAKDVDDIASTSDDEAVLSGPQTTGTVSGDVDVASENPWKTNGELNYDVPSDAKTIKSADVYINVYSGSANTNYGANANITITTNNGNLTFHEELWTNEGSANGTVYVVNENITKCYSDYMIHYNVKDLFQGTNGTGVKINVDTFKMDNKTFDGRIKLIAIVVAYDDGDTDVINYVIDDNQIWANTNKTITLDTAAFNKVLEAQLINIALSSSDATFKINGKFVDTPKRHTAGSYYQFNEWDITDLFIEGQNTEMLVMPGPGYSGPSYKSAITVLKVKSGDFVANVSMVTERLSSTSNGIYIVYPGTFNQITATVNTNKNGKYTLNLYADGKLVNSTEIFIDASFSQSTKVDLIDYTIRNITNKTVSTGAKTGYDTVNYTLELKLLGEVVNTTSLNPSILYNGYFSKDYSYQGDDRVAFLNATITGDIFIAIGNSGYTGSLSNLTEIWNVSLPAGSNFVKAYVYAPYTFGGADTADLFNVTFNGGKPKVVSFIRDQANVISVSGYGLIVYDVTDLIKDGENLFTLNKTHSTGAYTPTLIYLYNTTGSTVVKDVYISNGADLIGDYGNAAKRVISADSVISVDNSNVANAIAYIFGAGAKDGRVDAIYINGEASYNVWNTTEDSQINVFAKDVTKIISDKNKISVIANNDKVNSLSFTVLQQIFVVTHKTATKITASNVVTVYNKNKNLIATLNDVNGKPIANAKVTLVLNGATKTLTTNAKGQVSFAVANLKPKTYTAKLSFAGDGSHVKSDLGVKVTVKKANVKIAAKKKVFKAKSKVKKYSVVLKNNVGKPIKNAKLTLVIKNKKFTAKTNAKGQAIFKIKKFTKKGNYKAKVIFKKDNFYNGLTKPTKISIKK